MYRAGPYTVRTVMHHFCNHTTHTNPHPQYHTPTGKHTHTMRGLSFAHILATQAVNSSCRSDRYNNYHPKFLRHLIAATECTKRHTCACASTSSCTYAHDKQTHIHNHTHTYTHKDTYTPTHTHRHTQTHTQTCIHAHFHTRPTCARELRRQYQCLSNGINLLALIFM